MRLSDFDITIYDQLAEAKPAWQLLQQPPSFYAFQSLEWMECWLAATPEPGSLRIAVVRAGDGVPKLVLPLCIRPRHGLRRLAFMAEEVSDYQAPLIAPDFAAHFPSESVEPLFRDILARIPGVDYVSFRWMPEEIAGIANPLTQIRSSVQGISAFHAHLPERFSDFLSRKRKKIHQDTNRQLKRLSEIGPIVIERVTDPVAVADTVSTMLAQKAERFAGQPGPAAPPQCRFSQAFYTGMGAIRSPGLEGHVTRLTCNGETIATHIGIRQDERFYYIMPSFETQRWGRYSPGRILMEHLISEGIEQGVRIFDMTIGAEAYKRDWVDAEIKLYDVIRGVSLKGKAFCAARSAARTLRNRLRDATAGRAS